MFCHFQAAAKTAASKPKKTVSKAPASKVKPASKAKPASKVKPASAKAVKVRYYVVNSSKYLTNRLLW